MNIFIVNPPRKLIPSHIQYGPDDQFELSVQQKACWLRDADTGDKAESFTFGSHLEVTNFLRKLVNAPKVRVLDLYGQRITNTIVETMMCFNNKPLLPGMWLSDGTRVQSQAREMAFLFDGDVDITVIGFENREIILERPGTVTLCPEEPMFVVYR